MTKTKSFCEYISTFLTIENHSDLTIKALDRICVSCNVCVCVENILCIRHWYEKLKVSCVGLSRAVYKIYEKTAVLVQGRFPKESLEQTEPPPLRWILHRDSVSPGGGQRPSARHFRGLAIEIGNQKINKTIVNSKLGSTQQKIQKY